MATRNASYLKQAERICNTILDRMVDSRTGWILESFDKNWNYVATRPENNEIDVGHNIEVAWMLFRIHMINGRTDYLEKGKKLADKLHVYGFNPRTGCWYAGVGNADPSRHTSFAHWWIQAYGHMMDLCLAKLYPESGYEQTFTKGAAFWEANFLDREEGGTHLTVKENGGILNGQKANQFKASYHSVEHAMLNHLYLAQWIENGATTLHFRITTTWEHEQLYPLPIESTDAKLSEIKINGNTFIQSAVDVVKLPPLSNAHVAMEVK
jgi:mannose/cellobiose epimerase-like protein (N-acyl-D-glucosamine 2-epimerase family)